MSIDIARQMEVSGYSDSEQFDIISPVYYPPAQPNGRWGTLTSGTGADRAFLLNNGDSSSGLVTLAAGLSDNGTDQSLPIQSDHLNTVIDLTITMNHTLVGVTTGQPEYGQLILGWSYFRFGARVLTARSDIDNTSAQYSNRFNIVGDSFGSVITFPYPERTFRLYVRLGPPWTDLFGTQNPLLTVTSESARHIYQTRPGIMKVQAESHYNGGAGAAISYTTATTAGPTTSKGKFRTR